MMNFKKITYRGKSFKELMRICRPYGIAGNIAGLGLGYIACKWLQFCGYQPPLDPLTTPADIIIMIFSSMICDVLGCMIALNTIKK